MADTNRVQYGLSNCHVAVQTENVNAETGAVTYSYATQYALPGAVSVAFSAQANNSPFYADNRIYFQPTKNNGYQGDLTIAKSNDWFRKNVLGDIEDSGGAMVENADVEAKKFALLFEFEGDAHKVRHVLYNCSVTRPGINGNTTNESITPDTQTLTLTAMPRADGVIHAYASPTDTAYAEWYTTVFVPQGAANTGGGTGG